MRNYTKYADEVDSRLLAVILDAIDTCPLEVVCGVWGITDEDEAGNPYTRFMCKDTAVGVCPMGAMLLGTSTKEKSWAKAAAKFLGVPTPWVNGFISGVDNYDVQDAPLLFMRGATVGHAVRSLRELH